MVRTVGIRGLRPRLSRVVDEVSEHLDRYVITKRGKPVAKLIPLESDNARLIGSMKGKLLVRGKIFSTGIRWNAES